MAGDVVVVLDAGVAVVHAAEQEGVVREEGEDPALTGSLLL